ncbi:exodeoxyribonuclease VII large subunit [Mariniluteicoccus endophyticus]
MALQTSPESPQQLGAVVRAVKSWVERCGWVWVEAQVIEIKRRSSPVQFLTLRDRHAEVSVSVQCDAVVLDAAGPLREGMVVTARLQPQVWMKNGSLGFRCDDLRPSGEGRLLAELEARRQRLHAEGLFARELKKQLPFLPRRIGLVTAKGSAAERDVIENVRIRWPGAEFAVHHATMQGPSCVESVVAGLESLDRDPDVDVIVVARGGGSLEDLLPFSDEGLMRAVFVRRTPVVSAIGHEVDTPILDLVADVRASTPTDVARRVVPDVRDELRHVVDARQRLRTRVVDHVRREQDRLTQLRERPMMRDPLHFFTTRHDQIDDLRERAGRALDARFRTEQTALTNDLQRVRAVSPRSTLERGYAILVDGEGESVTSVREVDLDDDLKVYLGDGELVVGVRDIHTSEARNNEGGRP